MNRDDRYGRAYPSLSEEEIIKTEMAKKWISSPEGQAKLEKRSEMAGELIEYLREVFRLDEKVLHRPIDI